MKHLLDFTGIFDEILTNDGDMYHKNKERKQSNSLPNYFALVNFIVAISKDHFSTKREIPRPIRYFAVEKLIFSESHKL